MSDFIYCQRDIPKEKWRYGLRTSAATGCGWIATHNALKLMHYSPKPEKLIEYFEKQLPATTSTILKYLSSKTVKGIGPKTAKLIVEDKIDLIAADVNSDGRVNAMDATRILRYAAKFITELKIQK